MRDVHEHLDTGDGTSAPTALDAETGRMLFGSLQRSRQRVKAEQYVRGLLSVPGRKTLRSIATQFDGAAAQQRVHHFISTSPWDWMPIRRALARRTHAAPTPDAWVIAATLIPKAGPHSVGVDQQPTAFGTVHGQHAVGSWLVSPRSAVPVDWQLRLSARWRAEPLRERAGVPAGALYGSLEECVRQAVAELPCFEGAAPLPVVVDVTDGAADGVSIARFLASTGQRFAVRVSPAAQLRLDRSELPMYGDLQRTAGELAESFPQLRRQVRSGDGPTTAMAVPVVVPGSARGDSMVLLGQWRPAEPVRRRLWLTSLGTSSAIPTLLQRSARPRRP